ncbi:MAG: serine hydroxymethyltransferase [Legionella sp.]|jgi:glycine hydroxymethyltransferase
MLTPDKFFYDSALLRQAQDNLSQCDTFSEMQDLLLGLIHSTQNWRATHCINLVAAESPMSALARSVLSSDLSMRTAGGHIGEGYRYFMGTHFIDQIESIGHELLKKLFDCNYCEHRLLGGTQSCQVVYSALTSQNNTIISVMPQHGGDSSNCIQSMPGLLGLKIIPMPFLPDQTTIDLQQLECLVSQHSPKLISIGFSVCLFEQPLAAIRGIATQYNAQVFYDASHELGLIAGKCFANPFACGVDVVSGSTGKTFSGPQGGLLLWDKQQLTKPLVSTVFPNFVGTYQLNRVAALTVTALEFSEYGESYMGQVVKNAKALAIYLNELGISIFAKEKNYTQTHQVLINAEKYGGGFNAAKRLESCNIIGNHVNLPGDTCHDFPQVRGLRLATTEMTRRGLKEPHMKIIAELIYRALETKESSTQLATEVSRFSHEFQNIYYC